MFYLIKEFLRFGTNLIFAFMLTILFIGLNFNEFIFSETVFRFIIILLFVYGAVSFGSYVYWIIEFKWAQLNKKERLDGIFKVIVLMVILVCHLSFVVDVL